MKPLFFAILFLTTTAIIHGEETPSFVLHPGDAVRVSVERLGTRPEDNVRLSVVLNREKAAEYTKFTKGNAGKNWEAIVTDFKQGRELTAVSVCIPGPPITNGIISMVCANARVALKESEALLDCIPAAN